jgi:hypothetical protein
MWDTLILNPMVNALIWLYGLLGQHHPGYPGADHYIRAITCR